MTIDQSANTAAQGTKMPAAFIGHGSPMNTLELNRYTSAWRQWGASLPRPRAILVISAHWFIGATAVTAMARPRVIHDFYGFPKALFDFDYPAPGAPAIAEEIARTVGGALVTLDVDSWGLDHGAWSVLAHLFARADIPVLQLSLHAGESLAYHFDLGKRLAPLREAGILIVGSGNVVHNLRSLARDLPERAFPWANAFDREAHHAMTHAPQDVPQLPAHPSYRLAVPTTEHFLPLVYIAGLAAAEGAPAKILIEGAVMGSLTMSSYVLGCDPFIEPRAGETAAAAAMPSGLETAPENTNL